MTKVIGWVNPSYLLFLSMIYGYNSTMICATECVPMVSGEVFRYPYF
jgi:hypothetical protein